MIQSSHRFGLAASSPSFVISSSLAWWVAVLGFASAQPSTVRAPYASPQSPPAKLDSDKFGSSRRTKPVGLIESCTQGVGAMPPNPGAASPQECRWGSAPRPPLGLRPKPRSGGGGASSGVWGGAPSDILAVKRPGV